MHSYKSYHCIDFRDHLAEFTSAVAEVSATVSSQRRSATSYSRALFENLTKMVAAGSNDMDDESELGEDYSAVIEALPELYQCFLHQNRYTISLQLLKVLPLILSLHFRQEMVVSKSVEFKFFKKLLILLDIESVKHPPAESHSAGAMETDVVLDLEQTLEQLLAFEDPERSGTRQQRILNTLLKCLDLLWTYDVYQVR